MYRRKFLASTGAALASGGVSGCLGSGSSQQTESEDEGLTKRERARRDAFSAGETSERGHLAVTVHELVAATEIGITDTGRGYGYDDDTEVNTPDSGPSESEDGEKMIPPTAGGLWFLGRVEVEHIGKNRRPLPYPEEMFLPYSDDDEASQFFPGSHIVVRDEMYDDLDTLYNQRNIYQRGAFPSVNVSGWVLFEVPLQYNLDKVLFQVRWPPDSLDENVGFGGGDKNRPADSWKFTSDDLTRIPGRGYEG